MRPRRTAPERIFLWLAERGEATLSVAALAREAGCSENTAACALRDLEAAGVVVACPHLTPEGGSLPNTYSVADSEAPTEVLRQLARLGWATQAHLARATGLGDAAVRGALWALRATGAVEAACGRRTWGGEGRDVYRLAL